jgi:hypothetical protein
MARKNKQIQKITHVPARFDTLFADIRELILSARNTVARGINLVQVHTNFEIGRHIIEHEQQGKGRAAYGQEVIGQLGERLTEEFGRGYSKRNLELMRQFFVVYSGHRRYIAQSLTAQLPSTRKTQSPIAQLQPDKSAQVSPFILSWTYYVFLLGITDLDERRFYEHFSTTPFGQLLTAQIESPPIGQLTTAQMGIGSVISIAEYSRLPSQCCWPQKAIWQTASAELSRIKKSQTVSGKLPCPKTPTSMPGSINCICPAKTN